MLVSRFESPHIVALIDARAAKIAGENDCGLIPDVPRKILGAFLYRGGGRGDRNRGFLRTVSGQDGKPVAWRYWTGYLYVDAAATALAAVTFDGTGEGPISAR